MDKTQEEQLLKNGWKRETLCVHIDEFDKNIESGARRISYDLTDTFTQDQIAHLKNFANTVNSRFLNTRISFTGTGFVEDKK